MKKLAYPNIHRQTLGQWRGILSRLGLLTDQQLNGKSQSCPLPDCSPGKDRWRWSNYKDKGGCYCNQCKYSDGFELVAKLSGICCRTEFKEVCKIINSVLP